MKIKVVKPMAIYEVPGRGTVYVAADQGFHVGEEVLLKDIIYTVEKIEFSNKTDWVGLYLKEVL